MVPLWMLFDAMNWPLFNGWALAHGSFVIAWPALALIGLCLIEIARRSLRARTPKS